jgi:hypothetical protein
MKHFDIKYTFEGFLLNLNNIIFGCNDKEITMKNFLLLPIVMGKNSCSASR